MSIDINNSRCFFFIGVGGTGMSALAQYLVGTGKQVSGSDRGFETQTLNDVRTKLEAAGIACFFTKWRRYYGRY